MAFDDRFVLFLEGIPVFLKDFLRLRRFSKNHQTGGFAVQSMDDPDAFFGAGMGLPKVVGELKVGGFFGFGFAGDTEEVGGFLDDEEGGVFEEYFDTGG